MRQLATHPGKGQRALRQGACEKGLQEWGESALLRQAGGREKSW